jgi:hypothetical protein
MPLKLVAVLLISLASADLAFDAGCDPLPTGSATSVLAAEDEDGENCGSSCAADCFCCTIVTAASVNPSLPALESLEGTLRFAQAQAPDGVRPVPYHPPLS